MVLRTAMSGGTSMIASSVYVHNRIAEQQPDLLDVLYEPFPWSWQGQEPPGEPGWYLQPLFSLYDGKFACRYIRGHVKNSQRFEDAPRLTAGHSRIIPRKIGGGIFCACGSRCRTHAR